MYTFLMPNAQGGQKSSSDPWEYGATDGFKILMWMQGTESRSSARTTSALNS